MDIGKACYYADRPARERDGNPDWLKLCPKGHQHIKSTVEGWEGVQNGVFRIRGEDFKFLDWLLDIRDNKWKAGWDRFWSNERIVIG